MRKLSTEDKSVESRKVNQRPRSNNRRTIKCWKCGEEGHFQSQCKNEVPVKDSAKTVAETNNQEN